MCYFTCRRCARVLFSLSDLRQIIIKDLLMQSTVLVGEARHFEGCPLEGQEIRLENVDSPIELIEQIRSLGTGRLVNETVNRLGE